MFPTPLGNDESKGMYPGFDTKIGDDCKSFRFLNTKNPCASVTIFSALVPLPSVTSAPESPVPLYMTCTYPRASASGLLSKSQLITDMVGGGAKAGSDGGPIGAESHCP